MTTRRSSFFLLMSLAAAMSSQAQNRDLTNLDLETLMGMDVSVTSAARRAQSTVDAAAAVYVITREDIRRAGATSLPEVLRGVPGLHVARINARGWAVTSRGFPSRFANKLLVMVDGSSVYTSVFSGVLWEEQSVPLEEIERIEIVRGPGGALWGINAVNGVINIITRKALDASGLRVTVGSGTYDEAATVSVGATGEAIGDVRAYVDRNEIDALGASSGWSHTQAGIRLDRELMGGALTVHGDINDVDFGAAPQPPAAALPATARVGNTMASWERGIGAGQLDLRTYYSWTDRGSPSRWAESAFGFDAQLAAERIGPHVLTMGLGYRHAIDHMKEAWSVLTSQTPRVSQDQWSIYAQDEIYFLNDDVRITLGAKLEDLEFTKLAFQPTLRALWRATDTHTAWAAGSRAVRTPSRFELSTHTQFSAATPEGALLTYRIFGDEDLKPEDLYAYELGWRWRPVQTLSVDLALYRNEYEHVIVAEPLQPFLELGLPPRLVVPSQFVNLSDSSSEGAEIVVEWAAREWLRLEAQGAWHDRRGDVGQNGHADPKHSYMLSARVDLPHDAELDLRWRSVSRISSLAIDGYDTLNARLAWWPRRELEISLSMDNLFDDEHVEFIDDVALSQGARIGRSYFARLTWRPTL